MLKKNGKNILVKMILRSYKHVQGDDWFDQTE